MSSNSVESIFKESFDKLNPILMYRDNQLGTVSLTQEETEFLRGVKNEVEPVHKVLEGFNDIFYFYFLTLLE